MLTFRCMAQRMIAVAFGPATMAEALDRLPGIAQVADCVEVRLDHFEERYDLRAVLRARGNLPAVVTLRPPEEGGRSTLAPEERLRVLIEAAEAGAEYVDLEWHVTTREALDALHTAGAHVLVSRHDFAAMPAAFADGWWRELAERGADIVKIVGTARDPRDNLPVLRALRDAARPTVSIAMGEAGLLSRVLALRAEQCFLTYAMLDAQTSTAPGQLSATDMRETYHAARLGPATRVYGLLGPHVERERLAEYNAWFERDACDAVAVPVSSPVEGDAAGVIRAFRELPTSGWHIHGAALQANVVAAVDELTPKARAQGKANAIVLRGEALTGDWVESPAEQFALWRSA
jgi:3-dehydroquinate dehydratase type I